MTNDIPDLSHLEGVNDFLIMGDDGLPVGSIDLEQLQNDGANLAFKLAAHAGDEAKTKATLREAVETHGHEGIGYVLMNAIPLLTDDILGPSFDIMATATGTNPRAKMAEIGGIKA